MNNENEKRNSINKFELEGNVGSIGKIYENSNGKKSLRFDLAQNNKDNTQFVPIVIRGELVNTYGNQIQKGDWITIKGKISTYQKDVEKDGLTYKEKTIDIIGFEIKDKTNNKIYSSDGQVKEIENKNESIER